jgi:hypothetical protein
MFHSRAAKATRMPRTLQRSYYLGYAYSRVTIVLIHHTMFVAHGCVMSHRLLHTLVFASTSLLACGGQIGAVIDVPPEPDASKDATAPEDVSVDAGSDARMCEGGWPTTKGQICTFDAGIVCCTRGWEADGGGDPICCERGQ